MTTLAPPPPPPTRSGLLSSARHVVLPTGIVSTGFPSIRATCAEIGIRFDPWQEELNRCLLAKDASGLYAADTAVLSICRQAGKTYDIGALVFALCIKHPGLTVIWTAHRFKVSRETFNDLRTLARSPRLVPHIDYDAITTAAGNECIPFRNGSRIVFAARERGAIRGFTKVGVLILDEAQILTESAMSDLVPTTNQAPNPLIILMGTPPKVTDPGEVFTALRAAALAGESQGVLYVEYSADPECDSDDWAAVAEANPSFPKRTGKRAILRLRKLLTNEDDYRREGLGIWAANVTASPISPERWASLADEDSWAEDPVAFAVDTTPDRARTSIAAAGRRGDGRVHLEVIEHRQGTGWVVPRLVELVAKHSPCAVVLDPGSPAGAYIPDLEDAGIKVKPDEYDATQTLLDLVSVREHAQACSALANLVENDQLRHRTQAVLDEAVRGAQKRTVSDVWLWDRKTSEVDISPLVAVTLAAHGFAIHGDEDEGVQFW